MAVPDLSPAAIAARLANAPANGSPYTYQDYLNAGNDPTENQGQGADNFATAVLTGNPQYQQLLARAKAGDTSAQAALPQLAQTLIAQSGMDPSTASLDFGDTSSVTYGAGQNQGTGFDTPLAASIILGGFGSEYLPGLLSGGGASSAADAASGTTWAGTTAAAPGTGSAIGATAPAAAAAASHGLAPSTLQLLGAGLSTGGSLLNGYFQGKQQANNLKQQQAQTALNATQLDPYRQNSDAAKQALATALANNYKPVTYQNGQFTGGLNAIDPNALAAVANFTGPSAMQAASQKFNTAASAASGGAYPGGAIPGAPWGSGPAPSWQQLLAQQLAKGGG